MTYVVVDKLTFFWSAVFCPGCVVPSVGTGHRRHNTKEIKDKIKCSCKRQRTGYKGITIQSISVQYSQKDVLSYYGRHIGYLSIASHAALL